MDNKETLESVVGKEKAEQLLKLTDNFDKQILTFKNKINKVLKPMGFEAKVGVVFSELSIEGLENGTNLQISESPKRSSSKCRPLK